MDVEATGVGEGSEDGGATGNGEGAVELVGSARVGGVAAEGSSMGDGDTAAGEGGSAAGLIAGDEPELPS